MKFSGFTFLERRSSNQALSLRRRNSLGQICRLRIFKLATNSKAGRFDRIPEYFRDTVEWITGCRQSASGVQDTSTPPHSAHSKVAPSRQTSADVVDDDGCCLAKIFLLNIVSFATRSRRKGGDGANKEINRGPPQTTIGGKPMMSRSETAVGNSKSPAETGICDSLDDEMLRRLTTLPPGMDKDEWLATHTLSLFENTNALCGTITELCTPVSCPVMSYPGVPKAQWVDERRKHHPYPAMQYIDCAMSFCEKASKDEQLFPTKYGNVFAGHFESHCRRVIRLLWHCCGHLYANHWDQLAALSLRPQCSLVLAHMYTVAKMYGLLDTKELSTLANTIQLARRVVSRSGEENRGGKGGICGEGTGRGARIPSSKSGSWGGHPTAAALACKPYAHTC